MNCNILFNVLIGSIADNEIPNYIHHSTSVLLLEMKSNIPRNTRRWYFFLTIGVKHNLNISFS